jgi:hypothetical protein
MTPYGTQSGAQSADPRGGTYYYMGKKEVVPVGLAIGLGAAAGLCFFLGITIADELINDQITADLR